MNKLNKNILTQNLEDRNKKLETTNIIELVKTTIQLSIDKQPSLYQIEQVLGEAKARKVYVEIKDSVDRILSIMEEVDREVKEKQSGKIEF